MAATADDKFSSAAVKYSNALVYGLKDKLEKEAAMRLWNMVAFVESARLNCSALDSTKLALFREKHGL